MNLHRVSIYQPKGSFIGFFLTRKILPLFVLLPIFIECQLLTVKSPSNKSQVMSSGGSPKHLFYEINNATDLQKYATEFTGTFMSTKFVVDTNTGVPVEEGDVERNKLIFFDSEYYGVHESFVEKAIFRFIGSSSDDVYKAIGYTADPVPNLEVIPGDIIYIEELKGHSVNPGGPEEISYNRLGIAFRFTVQDYPAETIKVLELALQQIKRTAYLGKLIVFLMPMGDLNFLKDPNLQIGGKPFAENFEILPFYSLDTSGDTNLVYHEAKSFGYLNRISMEDFTKGEYTSKDILIMDEIPLDIGPLSGFISTVSQGIFSHTIIRARNQNIPNIRVLKSEIERALQDFDKEAGGRKQLVYFETYDKINFRIISQEQSRSSEYSRDKFASEADFLSQAEKYFSSRAPKLPPLALDNSPAELFTWSEREDDPEAKKYGAKGRNFAFLDRELKVSGVNRDEYAHSFLIPFSYYDTFISQTITPKLCDKAFSGCQEELPSENICQSVNEVCKNLSLKNMTIKDFIALLLDRGSGRYSQLIGEPLTRKSHLAYLQELIKAGDFIKSEKESIKDKLTQAFAQETRIRFRSSTNAEDLPGLSGAGLYSSHAGCLADSNGSKSIPIPTWDKKYFEIRACSLEKFTALINEIVMKNSEQYNVRLNSQSGAYEFSKGSFCATENEVKRNFALACRVYKGADDLLATALATEIVDDLSKDRPVFKAIRKVFASVWYEKAFLNRDYFGLDHEQVNMGVLVHPSFANELANGVLIVTDLPEVNLTKIQVSAQVEDISITNPLLPGVKGDVFYVTKDTASGALKEPVYNSRSTELLARQKPVLNSAQITDLVTQAITVHNKLRTMLGDQFTGQTDIEWKLMPNQTNTSAKPIIVIKQARPY